MPLDGAGGIRMRSLGRRLRLEHNRWETFGADRADQLAAADRASRSPSHGHHCARHRDERRGAARQSRSGLAVARRICLRRQRCLLRGRRHSRTLFPAASPRHQQLRSRTSLRLAKGFGCVRRALRHPKWSLRLGLAARGWGHFDAALQAARGDRRAGDPH